MNRFLALRYEHGLTQLEVAEGAKVSRGTLWAIERGTMPSAPVAAKLAGFYELTVDELLHGEVEAA